MTSNYLLAANVRVYQLLLRRPLFPSSLSFCCFQCWGTFQAGLKREPRFFFFFSCLECWNRKDCSCQTKPVSHREQQLPAVGNQWSFLQINSIQLLSTAHCRFLDVGFWKWDPRLWNTESLRILLFLNLNVRSLFLCGGTALSAWSLELQIVKKKKKKEKESPFPSNARQLWSLPASIAPKL